MKKTLIFGVVIALAGILVYYFIPKSVSGSYGNKLIDSSTIVLSVIFPETNGQKGNDLIVFALVKEGEYIPVTDYDEKKQIETNERDSILKMHKTFYTCKNGKLIKFYIDRVVRESYDCSELKVGRFRSKYKLDNISIASNFKLSCSKTFTRINPNAKDSLYFRITEDSVFRDVRTSFDAVDFEIVRFDNIKEFLCIVNAEDTTKAVTNLYFINYDNQKLSIIDSTKEGMDISSWGRGYKFLDYKDIDNDNVPELILLYYGYEWTTIVIYKKKGDKYITVLENVIYGC